MAAPRTHRVSLLLTLLALGSALAVGRISNAQPLGDSPPLASSDPNTSEEPADDAAPPRLPPPEGAKAMPEPDRVWVDVKAKRVYADGYVSLREGYLEMFACIVGTKEHESVVALESRAQVVHAALLSIGAVPGSPAQFHPEFKPPTGDTIKVLVTWRDETGKMQEASAASWVVDSESKKQLDAPWVFGGSGFWKDETTGKEYYMAEAGDLICVSNFSSATLDVPIESSSAMEGLLFEANTEVIPPLGTPVRVILSVENGKKAKDQAAE